MIKTMRLLKVSALWVSIIYVVCYGGVALVPGIQEWTMQYAFHTTAELGENIATLSTFVSGLIIWNVFTLLVMWLFATLWNNIKK